MKPRPVNMHPFRLVNVDAPAFPVVVGDTTGDESEEIAPTGGVRGSVLS